MIPQARQLEKEQAELRMALNEVRRRAVKLDKALQHAEGGNMLSRNAVKQVPSRFRMRISFCYLAHFFPSAISSSSPRADRF